MTDLYVCEADGMYLYISASTRHLFNQCALVITTLIHNPTPLLCFYQPGMLHTPCSYFAIFAAVYLSVGASVTAWGGVGISQWQTAGTV